MDHHLAREEPGTSRNGYGRKTVVTDTGKLDLQIPRDRQANFDPQLIAKYQRCACSVPPSPGGVHRACRKVFGVYPALSLRAAYAPPNRRWPMILSAIAEKLKRRSKADFKGRHFEATLILQAVSWYLR